MDGGKQWTLIEELVTICPYQLSHDYFGKLLGVELESMEEIFFKTSFTLKWILILCEIANKDLF